MSREGLYIMVFIILINTCTTYDMVKNIEIKVDSIITHVSK
jgi:hypothetical protein